MAKDDIKLSPKHGVNPTMSICFWCGEHTGEIAMLGKLDNQDFGVPREMVLSYDPCDDCKAKWDLGVTIVEVSPTPIEDNQIVVSTQDGIDMYPTGRFAVVKEDAMTAYEFGEAKIVQFSTELFQEQFGQVGDKEDEDN